MRYNISHNFAHFLQKNGLYMNLTQENERSYVLTMNNITYYVIYSFVGSLCNGDVVMFSQAVQLIKPRATVQYHPVDKAVGNAHNKSPDLVKPVDLE